jgi:hypothetical protein
MVCTTTGSKGSQFWFVSVWFTVVVAKPRTNQQEGKRSAMTKLQIMPRYARQPRNQYAQNDVANVGEELGCLTNEVYNEAPATTFRASTSTK